MSTMEVSGSLVLMKRVSGVAYLGPFFANEWVKPLAKENMVRLERMKLAFIGKYSPLDLQKIKFVTR